MRGLGIGALVFALLAVACGDATPPPVGTGDAAGPSDAQDPVDAGAELDSGLSDLGSIIDTGISATDAGPSADAAQDASLDAGDAEAADVSDAGAAADAATADASPADASPADASSFRESLSVCWTEPGCARKMAIAHGGDWNAVSAPYDSNAAIQAAYMNGLEGVKIDVRVTSDNVPVIAHSSPIEIYESLNCANQRIEDMTAAEVTQCHRLPSSTENFQRLDDVINYLRGKMVAQLTVKLSSDYARTIDEIIALGAQDFTFMEINRNELQNLIPTLPGSDQVWYLINVGTDYSEIDTLIDTVQNPRAFMIEMDLGTPVPGLIANRIHPAGLKAFTYDSSATASVQQLLDLYNQGFDVVSAQKGGNNVSARMMANQALGITPP